MRKFASERVSTLLKRLGMKEGEEISHPWVTKAIARAQRKVEAYHFDIRKNLLEYDEVMNEQRKLVYSQRQEILDGGDLRGMVRRMMEKILQEQVRHFLTAPEGELVPTAARKGTKPPSDTADDPSEDSAGPEEPPDRVALLGAWFADSYGIQIPDLALDPDVRPRDQIDPLVARLLAAYETAAEAKREKIGPEAMARIERFILLLKTDEKWKDHLHAMDHLRHGIGLRGYGQIDPKVAYKQEGYQMFSQMISNLRSEVTELMLRVEVRKEDESKLGTNLDHAQYRKDDPNASVGGQAGQAQAAAGESQEPVKPIRNVAPKVGRNDLCPCGSGKKYKRCCGLGKGP